MLTFRAIMIRLHNTVLLGMAIQYVHSPRRIQCLEVISAIN